MQRQDRAKGGCRHGVERQQTTFEQLSGFHVLQALLKAMLCVSSMYMHACMHSCMCVCIHVCCMSRSVLCGNACTRVCMFLCRHGQWQERMRVEGPKEHLINMGCVVEGHILCMASHNCVVFSANSAAAFLRASS